jgi:hypothetical protein
MEGFKMNKFCLSCGMPLFGADGKEMPGNYCQYCTDEKGNLKSKEEITKGIAGWLQSWAPDTTGVDFTKRAEFYIKSMPAWAEK